jgi:hypothetical protein
MSRGRLVLTRLPTTQEPLKSWVFMHNSQGSVVKINCTYLFFLRDYDSDLLSSISSVWESNRNSEF